MEEGNLMSSLQEEEQVQYETDEEEFEHKHKHNKHKHDDKPGSGGPCHIYGGRAPQDRVSR